MRSRSTKNSSSVVRLDGTIHRPVVRAFVSFMNRKLPSDLLCAPLEIQAFRRIARNAVERRGQALRLGDLRLNGILCMASWLIGTVEIRAAKASISSFS